MSFRRIPFSFETTNPAERQAELMRRFGVPTEDTMFIDNRDDPFGDGFSHSSPRLQHRIPRVMTEGHPIKVEHEGYGINVDSPKAEPKVRVIPIHIEGRDDTKSQNARQRNLSGSSIPVNKANNLYEDHVRQRTNSGSFPSSQSTYQSESKDLNNEFSNSKSKPKVHNIPIFVEGQSSGEKLRQCRSVPIQKETGKNPKKANGPCVSKSATEPSILNNKEPDYKISLKKIESIMNEFKSYEDAVEKFSGDQRDKKYRYLDEMLTRCMLNLDDVETFGNDEVRKSRKEAVKKVQNSINVLEAKVQPKEDEKSVNGIGPSGELVTGNTEKDETMDIEMVPESETGAKTIDQDNEVINDHKIDASEDKISELNSDSQDINSLNCDNFKKSTIPDTKDCSDNEKLSGELLNTKPVISTEEPKTDSCTPQIQPTEDTTVKDSVLMDCVDDTSESAKTVLNDVEMNDVQNESLEPSDNKIPLSTES